MLRTILSFIRWRQNDLNVLQDNLTPSKDIPKSSASLSSTSHCEATFSLNLWSDIKQVHLWSASHYTKLQRITWTWLGRLTFDCLCFGLICSIPRIAWGSDESGNRHTSSLGGAHRFSFRLCFSVTQHANPEDNVRLGGYFLSHRSLLLKYSVETGTGEAVEMGASCQLEPLQSSNVSFSCWIVTETLCVGCEYFTKNYTTKRLGLYAAVGE